MARDSDCRAYTADPGVLGQNPTSRSSDECEPRNEAGRALRQLRLVFLPPGLCGYWHHVDDLSCGLARREGVAGALCAKCDELRSWLQQYLARDSDA
jgi:hypothetical protein